MAGESVCIQLKEIETLSYNCTSLAVQKIFNIFVANYLMSSQIYNQDVLTLKE